MGSKPLLALLSGIGAGTLLFGPLAITSSVPLQETRIAAPEVRTWIPVNGLWTRCDPARVNHSDQAVRWKPAFHVVDIKEHGRWKTVSSSGIGLVESVESSLRSLPDDGKD